MARRSDSENFNSGTTFYVFVMSLRTQVTEEGSFLGEFLSQMCVLDAFDEQLGKKTLTLSIGPRQHSTRYWFDVKKSPKNFWHTKMLQSKSIFMGNVRTEVRLKWAFLV